MKKHLIRVMAILAFAGCMLSANMAGAADDKARNRDAEIAVDNMGMKLCRGLCNTATGWCELIPRQFIRSYELDGPWLCAPYGLARGLMMTVVRTGAGVFETLTFYVPVDATYSSIIDPAYVWQPEKEKK